MRNKTFSGLSTRRLLKTPAIKKDKRKKVLLDLQLFSSKRQSRKSSIF